MHGGKRPIADIDMYISNNYARIVLERVKEYLSKPLTHYIEGSWYCGVLGGNLFIARAKYTQRNRSNTSGIKMIE